MKAHTFKRSFSEGTVASRRKSAGYNNLKEGGRA